MSSHHNSVPSRTLLRLTVLAVLAALAFGGASQAQRYSFIGSGLIGVGGSFDENESGYGNPSFQLGFSNVIEDRTLFGIRVGGLELDSEDGLGELSDPSLLYVTLVGEYRETTSSFSGRFIEPAVYMGLGFYDLDGVDSDGQSQSDQSIGLVVGLVGDMPLRSKRDFLLRIELQGHWADLDAAQLFGFAQVGIAYRF